MFYNSHEMLRVLVAIHRSKFDTKRIREASRKRFSRYPSDSLLYARDVIRGRFPEGEKTILESGDSWQAYWYARGVMKERWREAEEMIPLASSAARGYLKFFGLDEFMLSGYPQDRLTLYEGQTPDILGTEDV